MPVEESFFVDEPVLWRRHEGNCPRSTVDLEREPERAACVKEAFSLAGKEGSWISTVKEMLLNLVLFERSQVSLEADITKIGADVVNISPHVCRNRDRDRIPGVQAEHECKE